MAAFDRRKVTMTSAVATPRGVEIHEATDYVALEHIELYVADAKTRWQSVVVGEETDHGPGGEDGDYSVEAATNAPDVPEGHPSHPSNLRGAR